MLVTVARSTVRQGERGAMATAGLGRGGRAVTAVLAVLAVTVARVEEPMHLTVVQQPVLPAMAAPRMKVQRPPLVAMVATPRTPRAPMVAMRRLSAAVLFRPSCRKRLVLTRQIAPLADRRAQEALRRLGVQTPPA